MFFDRVKYAASKVDDSTFNVALSPGFRELSTSEARASLYAIDSAGLYAHIDGYRAGSQILVNFIYSSSESDNSMPDFGAGLIIYSTVGGEVLQNEIGIGAIVHIGQSNGMGTEENSKGDLDYNDSRILQWSTSNNGLILADDPLEHYAAPRANSVGMSMTFAKDVLQRERHNQICIIPYCEGSTGFGEGQWIPDTGYLYNGVLAVINSFLALNPNNYIIAVIWSLGEDDAADFGYTSAFESNLDNATESLRADIVGNVRMPSASQVPFLVTGMSQDWTSFPLSRPIIQSILEDTPNRLSFTGYVSSVGATTQTEINNIHFDTAGYRLIGSRMYDQLVLARGNIVAGANEGTVNATLDDFVCTASGGIAGLVAGTVNVTLDEFTSTASGNVDVTIEGTVNATLGDFVSSASGAVSGNVTGSLNETLGEFTSNASGDVVTPVSVEVLYNRGVGQTTGATVTWANQGTLGATYDASQSTAAFQPTFDASGNCVFDGIDDRLGIAPGIVADSSGYSIMARVNLTDATGTFLGSDKDSFYTGGTGELRSISGSLSNIVNSGVDLTPGTWYKVYVTVRGSDNRQELFINGASVATATIGAFNTIKFILNMGTYNSTSNPLEGKISDMAIERGVLPLATMNNITAGW